MATTDNNYFKLYQRQSRVQASEDSFNQGMCFTKIPLTEGKARLLVNYDLVDEGTVITPRAGMRVNTITAPFNPVTNRGVFDANMQVQLGKDSVEEDDKRYRLVTYGSVSGALVPGTKLHLGQMNMSITDMGEDALTALNSYGVSAYDSSVLNLSNVSGSAYSSYFLIPENCEAHKIPITDMSRIVRAVGTFAYGNNYYSFNSNKQLLRTVYKTPEGESAPRYVVEELTPRAVTPKEAVLWGYNMLKPDPYMFNDDKFAGTIQLLGLLPYDATGNIKLSPLINTSFKLRCFYQGAENAKYKIVWDWKETAGTTWTALATQEITIPATGDLPKLEQDFSSPVEAIMVRVQAYKWNGSAYDALVEKVMTVGFNFSKEGYGSSANLNLKSYDLTKATGMVYWQQRLFLYGLAQDPTILFASEINDPSYFPYPNNIDLFDEPIVHAVPIMDNMLVFTRTKVIQLTRSDDGSTWTKKTIQGNLDFTDWDVHLIQIVKNMVFFKSGNYYYMIVPKTVSLKNELAIAPVSKNIEYFLDEFEANVTLLFKTVYDYTGVLSLVDYYNYLDYEDIHNVYVFKDDKGKLLNLGLLYNTMDRTWRIHLYESTQVYHPFRQDATKQGILMSMVTCQVKNNDQYLETPLIQFLEYDKLNLRDFYIPSGFKVAWTTTLAEDTLPLDDAFEAAHVYHNWQLLDTGNRNHSLDLNKRYREIQFKFNNISKKTLHFMTEFVLDGDTRVAFFQYETEHIVDPMSPDYGLLYISRIPLDSVEVPGNTVLGVDANDINAWALDFSYFPEVMLWKVRMQVSGKGYAPRIRLLSKNEERYEILGYTWVFRMMNSR